MEKDVFIRRKSAEQKKNAPGLFCFRAGNKIAFAGNGIDNARGAQVVIRAENRTSGLRERFRNFVDRRKQIVLHQDAFVNIAINRLNNLLVNRRGVDAKEMPFSNFFKTPCYLNFCGSNVTGPNGRACLYANSNVQEKLLFLL
jgi:hypothetical protein